MTPMTPRKISNLNFKISNLKTNIYDLLWSLQLQSIWVLAKLGHY